MVQNKLTRDYPSPQVWTHIKLSDVSFIFQNIVQIRYCIAFIEQIPYLP